METVTTATLSIKKKKSQPAAATSLGDTDISFTFCAISDQTAAVMSFCANVVGWIN